MKKLSVYFSKAVKKLGLEFVAIHARMAATEFKVLIVHSINFFYKSKKYKNKKGLKLNLGCGRNYKTGWINIDLDSNTDLKLDLRKPFPFDDNSCSMIYSEHFFEHLTHPQHTTINLMESYRVLESGGILHIGVPNSGNALVNYAKIVEEGKVADEYQRHPAHPEWITTRMDGINFMFRQNYHWWDHQHKWVYDYFSLNKMLNAAGFTNIKQRDFDETLDSEKRKGSLYVMAQKP